MGLMESQNTEFTREYVSELRKEVVAFVNSDGGKILVGVEDNGTVCGRTLRKWKT